MTYYFYDNFLNILFSKVIKNIVIRSLIVSKISYIHNDHMTYTRLVSVSTITSYVPYNKLRTHMTDIYYDDSVNISFLKSGTKF